MRLNSSSGAWLVDRRIQWLVPRQHSVVSTEPRHEQVGDVGLSHFNRQLQVLLKEILWYTHATTEAYESRQKWGTEFSLCSRYVILLVLPEVAESLVCSTLNPACCTAAGCAGISALATIKLIVSTYWGEAESKNIPHIENNITNYAAYTYSECLCNRLRRVVTCTHSKHTLIQSIYSKYALIQSTYHTTDVHKHIVRLTSRQGKFLRFKARLLSVSSCFLLSYWRLATW